MTRLLAMALLSSGVLVFVSLRRKAAGGGCL